MPDYPPFMNAYNLIPKILEKIKQAKTPERFTADFLANSLGFKGGSPRAFIPLAKRIGLLASDGTPTALYNSFRNPKESGNAMAKAIMSGYPALYSRNESAHTLKKEELAGLVMEATGLRKGADIVRSICRTFEALKGFAVFKKANSIETQEIQKAKLPDTSPITIDKGIGMNLSYTINLNLPKTDDIAVFNAIFKSLRENLLKQ